MHWAAPPCSSAALCSSACFTVSKGVGGWFTAPTFNALELAKLLDESLSRPDPMRCRMVVGCSCGACAGMQLPTPIPCFFCADHAVLFAAFGFACLHALHTGIPFAGSLPVTLTLTLVGFHMTLVTGRAWAWCCIHGGCNGTWRDGRQTYANSGAPLLPPLPWPFFHVSILIEESSRLPRASGQKRFTATKASLPVLLPQACAHAPAPFQRRAPVHAAAPPAAPRAAVPPPGQRAPHSRRPPRLTP
eukprot:365100-Chlamydomonas_euryale.AAC.13